MPEPQSVEPWYPAIGLPEALRRYRVSAEALVAEVEPLVRGSGGPMRFADMFAIAAANRAIQLALAIELNVQALLFFAAAPLLRVHLDGMLRLGY